MSHSLRTAARMCCLCIALTLGAVAIAQNSNDNGEPPPVDEALFEQGQELFRANCVECHQSDGSGIPPTFPALNENDRLTDLFLITTNVHQGQGAMPAFPDLDGNQIAALATYVRNAWDNDFGGASPKEVEEILAGLDQDQESERSSIGDGVYTEAQAERGQRAYSGHCAECHGKEGDGAGLRDDAPSSPPLAGDTFLRDWSGSSVAAFYGVAKNTMPRINPGGLDDQEYIDIIAYLLQSSDMPAGSEELPPDPDVLQNITIAPPTDAE